MFRRKSVYCENNCKYSEFECLQTFRTERDDVDTTLLRAISFSLAIRESDYDKTQQRFGIA